MTADKIQRWALYVSQFCYKTMVKRRHDKNADFFPRVLITHHQPLKQSTMGLDVF